MLFLDFALSGTFCSLRLEWSASTSLLSIVFEYYAKSIRTWRDPWLGIEVFEDENFFGCLLLQEVPLLLGIVFDVIVGTHATLSDGIRFDHVICRNSGTITNRQRPFIDGIAERFPDAESVFSHDFQV